MDLANNKVRTNVYLDATNKELAREIFKQYGLWLSEAFNIFLTQSVLEGGIPFEIKIPNSKTRQAILDAKAGKNMTNIDLNELKASCKCQSLRFIKHL